MKKTAKLIFLAAGFSIAALSCKKKDNIIASAKEATNQEQFNIDTFEQNIINALSGKTVGYSYSISKKGTVVRNGAGGFAVAPWDAGGGVPHNPKKRQEIASCSKTITALALLSILQERGMNGDEGAYKYMPVHWDAEYTSFIKISLKDLIKHESGLPAWGIGYNNLRSLANNYSEFKQGTYDYQNVNYAYLRVAIAYASPTANLKAYEKSLTNAWGVFGADVRGGYDEASRLLDSAISSIYINEVNKRVFSPSGIPFTKPSADGEVAPTLNYKFDSQAPGFIKGDMTKYVGSTGWRLSTTEQNAIMAYLKHTTKIIGEDWKQKMNDELLGWSQGRDVKGGKAYLHGGYHNDMFGMPDKKPAVSFQRGCFAVHIIFPNNYECAVQVNSLGGTNNMESTVIPCYENAWVK